jgi:hypothetical protein
MSTAGKSLYQVKELNICLFLFYRNQIKKINVHQSVKLYTLKHGVKVKQHQI